MKRKLVTLLMASLMMSMPLSVSAATGDVPSDAKTVSVSITNIEDADEVTAYRIVTPTYDSTEGFVKFDVVENAAIQDIENPTGEEITTIAQGIINGTISPDKVVQMTGSDNTYTASLPAGEYVVLVKNSNNAKFVYNPMVVSAYYTDANEADSLTATTALDADSSFTGNAYAKKTTIPLDKEITDADGATIVDDDSTDGSQADDLGIGDTGKFTIRTKIPAWSDAYKAKGVTYKLTDTQDDGFDAPTDIVVNVGGSNVAAADDTFKQTVTGNDFVLEFASNFALAHAGQDVIVTYSAKLNGSSKQMFEANNDKVRLDFTNDVQGDIAYYEDTVQEYTFPVQVKKTNEEGTALSGAEFTLTRTDGTGKTGTNEFKVTTGTDGKAQFDRLDEGTYTVKETKAPEGYAVNPDTFEITITPEYNTDGSLKKYDISMKNQTKDVAVKDVSVENPDGDILAGNITDSKLQTLPASGGEGTKTFFVVSAGLAGITLGLFVLGKKKEKKA